MLLVFPKSEETKVQGVEEASEEVDSINFRSLWTELGFVATVTTGGRVKFVPAV